MTVRIDRRIGGKPGDVKPGGYGISELRIDYGPGYRVYYPNGRRRADPARAAATSPVRTPTSGPAKKIAKD